MPTTQTDTYTQLAAWSGYAQAIATLIAVACAGWLTSRTERRQKRIQLTHELNQRHLNALQIAWSLLQYTTFTENARSIILWSRPAKNANGSQATGESECYSIHIANAQHFIQHALPDAQYGSQAGLYWSSELKASLYEYRSNVYGLVLKAQTSTTNPTAIIHNTELIQRLKKLDEQLRDQLRAEIEQRQRSVIT
ncbi:MAG: type VI-B CRISPR accessory protein Csx28 [Formosimonas sp.]